MKKHKAEVITLFEGVYHIGLAGLINSLVKFNYKGNIWIGYRGDLPPWINQFEHNKIEDYLKVYITDEVQANFIFLNTDIHFTNYKPYFLSIIKDLCAKDIQGLFYFDPDIIINQKWDFFENWISYGVAICEDPSMSFSISHPIRKRREEFISNYGYEINNSPSAYFNAGFIGVHFSDFALIMIWIELFELFTKEKLIDIQPSWNIGRYMATDIFSRVEDQDILNMAVQLYDGKLSVLGPDGMGFSYGFISMFHFTGQPKPWTRKNVYELTFRGKKPSYGQKMFMNYLRYPIRIYPEWKITLKKIDLFMANVLSRLISLN